MDWSLKTTIWSRFVENSFHIARIKDSINLIQEQRKFTLKSLHEVGFGSASLEVIRPFDKIDLWSSVRKLFTIAPSK